MTREFVILPEFDRQWSNLGLDDHDLKDLQEYLCTNPDVGSIIVGTGGLRKCRWAFDGRGKSGSIRTLYIDFAFYEKIFLITAYSKNEKDNLTQAEKNSIRIIIKEIESELERKWRDGRL